MNRVVIAIAALAALLLAIYLWPSKALEAQAGPAPVQMTPAAGSTVSVYLLNENPSRIHGELKHVSSDWLAVVDKAGTNWIPMHNISWVSVEE